MSDQQQIDDLQVTRDRKVAHRNRSLAYWDEAPDGHPKRAEALETVHRLNREIQAIDDQIYEIWEKANPEAGS